MSNKNSVTELSKFIALILRHQPSAAEITLDENGWAQTSALIAGVNKTGRVLDMPLLKQIVNTDEKGRYSFNADFTKIRANQGHSVHVCVEMERRVPPARTFSRYGGKIFRVHCGKRNFEKIAQLRALVGGCKYRL